MKIGYIVSMFPCWSETFILNELVDHRRNGAELSIYSLRKFNEQSIQDDAAAFLDQTVYPLHILDFRLWLLHWALILTSTRTYLETLYKLLTFRTSSIKLRLKALAVFLLCPVYVHHARKNRLQHLHAHFATYPALLGAIIKSFTGISFSFTAHAHDIYVNQDLLPILCGQADAIVTISEFNKNFLISRLESESAPKIYIIRCGIELGKFQFMDEKAIHRNGTPFQILSIGRLTGIKGFSYLIESLGLLRAEGFNVKCNIVGDGPLKNDLKELVDRLGLNKAIDFQGFLKTEEIAELLRAADTFVLACATDRKEGHDGIPIVFMEAMARGVPVIGTRLSGIPELVRHLDTGLCAEPENARSLSQQIKYAIENPDTVERMRLQARRCVETNFNIEKSGSELRHLFGRIQGGRQVWDI